MQGEDNLNLLEEESSFFREANEVGFAPTIDFDWRTRIRDSQVAQLLNLENFCKQESATKKICDIVRQSLVCSFESCFVPQLGKYQEKSELLDPHLEAMTNALMGMVLKFIHASAAPTEKGASALRLGRDSAHRFRRRAPDAGRHSPRLPSRLHAGQMSRIQNSLYAQRFVSCTPFELCCCDFQASFSRMKSRILSLHSRCCYHK